MAGDAFENSGKIVGVAVAAGQTDVLYIDPGILHHSLGLLNAEFIQIGGKIDMEALLKQLAEIGVGIIHGVCDIFHGEFVHIMGLNKAVDILPHHGHTGILEVRPGKRC